MLTLEIYRNANKNIITKTNIQSFESNIIKNNVFRILLQIFIC